MLMYRVFEINNCHLEQFGSIYSKRNGAQGVVKQINVISVLNALIIDAILEDVSVAETIV